MTTKYDKVRTILFRGLDGCKKLLKKKEVDLLKKYIDDGLFIIEVEAK